MHKTQDKSRIPKLQAKKFWLLVIGSLVIIWNLVLGYWNLTYAQDKIIAIVNNDIITQKDLDDFVNFMRMQLSQELEGKELENKIQSIELDLIGKLIEDRLILQEAKRVLAEAKKNNNRLIINRLEVDPNRIKARINQMKKRYGSEAAFENAIIQQGLTQADIALKIEEQFLMYNIIDLKIKDKIAINPSEVTDFYQRNSEKFITPQQRQVTVITLKDENLANEIFRQLNQKQNIDAIASKYSLALDKLTVAQNKELRKDIEEAIFKLDITGASFPIKVNDNFYIFRLDNMVMPRQETLPEVQDRIYAFLFDLKMQKKLADWLDELRAKSYIKIVHTN